MMMFNIVLRLRRAGATAEEVRRFVAEDKAETVANISTPWNEERIVSLIDRAVEDALSGRGPSPRFYDL